MKIERTQNRITAHYLKYILVLFTLIASLSLSSQAQVKTGNLKVVIHNIKSKTGQVAFFLFNSADAFPGHTEKALLSGYVKAAGNTAE